MLVIIFVREVYNMLFFKRFFYFIFNAKPYESTIYVYSGQ